MTLCMGIFCTSRGYLGHVQRDHVKGNGGLYYTMQKGCTSMDKATQVPYMQGVIIDYVHAQVSPYIGSVLS